VPGPARRSGPLIDRDRGPDAAILQCTQHAGYPFTWCFLGIPGLLRISVGYGARGDRHSQRSHRGPQRWTQNPKPKFATLTVGNKNYGLPDFERTVGPDVIDIAKLYAQSRMFTYDPVLPPPASCQSKITYIDGDAGKSWSTAATRSSSSRNTATSSKPATSCFTASCRPGQKADFDNRVIHHTMVTSRWRGSSRASAATPNPMAIMVPGGRALGRVLPRLHRHHRSAASA